MDAPLDAAGPAVVGRQRVALLWTADEAGSEVGGVDLLALRDGRVGRSWTLRGTRGFRY